MIRRKLNKNKGASLVELALTLPIFLMIVFALIELYRHISVQEDMSNVIQELARGTYRKCAEVRDPVESTTGPISVGTKSLMKTCIKDNILNEMNKYAIGLNASLPPCYEYPINVSNACDGTPGKNLDIIIHVFRYKEDPNPSTGVLEPKLFHVYSYLHGDNPNGGSDASGLDTKQQGSGSSSSYTFTSNKLQQLSAQLSQGGNSSTLAPSQFLLDEFLAKGAVQKIKNTLVAVEIFYRFSTISPLKYVIGSQTSNIKDVTYF